MITVGSKLPKGSFFYKEYCTLQKYVSIGLGSRNQTNWSKPFLSERLGPKGKLCIKFNYNPSGCS